MKKKAAAGLLALLLAGLLGVTAQAREWEGRDLTFTVPEEFVYTFDLSIPAEDPTWALVGESDPAARRQEYQEMGIVADFYTEDGLTNVVVMEKTTDTSESIYSLKDITQEERDAFLDQLVQARTDEVTLDKSYVEFGGQPFCRVRTDLYAEDQEAHEMFYFTVVNGHTLNFLLYNDSREIAPEQEALLEEMASSTRITSILPKPEPQPLEQAAPLIMGGLLAVAVLSPLVWAPIKRRRDKRQKEQMAARLSQYRRDQKEGGDLGEVRFVNETDCTKEAIHSFSVYQAYVRGLGGLLLGAALCVLMIAVSFLVDLEWWLKLLSVAITVYYAYRAFNMSSAVERIQTKVFQRGMSTTARYLFYENAFRVSGVQSGNVYPYFQITAVRRHGHYLYLYYGPENAYLVDQFGFSQGQFEEFETFIRKKTEKGA